MITLKHGCDLTDVLVTCRFALLVKSLQWNRNIQCGSSCRKMLTLFKLFGVAFLFIWCGNGIPTPLFLALHSWYSTTLLAYGNGIPTPLFLALHSCAWPLQPIVFKWRRNTPSTGIASRTRIETTWMRCATLGPVMLINRKFDISCKLDISRNLSTFPVSCI